MVANSQNCRGHSLFDALMMVATLMVVSSVMVNVAASLRQNAQRIKLENDVNQLNQAVAVFKSAGGNLTNAPTAESVLATLKSRLSGGAAGRFVGVGTGALIDDRIELVRLPEEETQSNHLRAYWDPVGQKFRTTLARREGIKRFVLAEESGVVVSADGRGSVVEYASNGTWIWDYVEAPTELPPAVSDFTPGAVASVPATPAPVSPSTPSVPTSPPPGPTGGGSGGIALNLGSGSASANDGIALNLLSDNVEANEGEVALGILGLNLKLGGNSTPSESTGSPASGGSDAATGTTTTANPQLIFDQNGILVNAGQGQASASNAISGNLGEGNSTSSNGVSLNGGSGSSSSSEGISGNLGSGSSSANQGIGLNFGSGSASAGNP